MSRAPILIVDDNPVNLKLARLLLQAGGYEVRTAGSAEEALDLLAVSRPGLVLMDIQMPGMDGLQLTRLLKANPKTRDLPVVALTACAKPGDEEEALASGCVGYIAKPIDTRQFPRQIAGFLAAGGTAMDGGQLHA